MFPSELVAVAFDVQIEGKEAPGVLGNRQLRRVAHAPMPQGMVAHDYPTQFMEQSTYITTPRLSV